MEVSLGEKAREDVAEVRMTFGEHLEELRWRLIKCVVAGAVCFLVAMVFYKELLDFICAPHFRVMRWMGKTEIEARFLSVTYTKPIWSILKLGFIVSVFAASPVIAWQIWRFVAAGLYRHERRHVTRYAVPSFLLFVGGCVFGYLILVPYGLYGMASMLQIDIVSEQYALPDYLDLVMVLTVITGAVFELPLIMMFTSSIGVTGPRFFLKWSRHAIVAIVLAAAILTPSPDIFSQLLMAVPMLVLYFMGVGLCALVAKPAGKKA